MFYKFTGNNYTVVQKFLTGGQHYVKENESSIMNSYLKEEDR
jgi:hypothetical protein